MSTITKQQLEQVLLTILVYDRDTSLPIGGLLTEKLTLKTKRLLQKIRTEVFEHFEEFRKDLEAIKAEKEKNPELDSEKEVMELFKEEITLKSELPSLSSLDSIESDKIYDTVIIEKITNASN